MSCANQYGEKEASSYESDREVEPIWHVENNFVRDYFASRVVDNLLDIPVGTGRFFHYYNSVKKITGVDLSQEMLAQASIKATAVGTEIELFQGKLLELHFPDGYFDVAVCWRLFHLLDAKEVLDLVSELGRICS